MKTVEHSLKIGDIVTYAVGKTESGGVIYQVTEDVPPQASGGYDSKKVPCEMYDCHTFMDGSIISEFYKWEISFYAKHGTYPKEDRDFKIKYKTGFRVVYGWWGPNGEKIQQKDAVGHVRLKPVFDLFATDAGKRPRGKGKTLLVYYSGLHNVKKVNIVDLGKKYVELGMLMQDIARKGGMETKDG